jgi:hypothetical protein
MGVFPSTASMHCGQETQFGALVAEKGAKHATGEILNGWPE